MYYRIIGEANNFANYLPHNYSMSLAEMFDGRKLSDGWVPLHFELLSPDDDRPIPEIITGYIPICSRRVYEAIKATCKEFVEFLPCTLGEERREYFVFNIVGFRGTVDYNRSVYKCFPGSTDVMYFNKIVLDGKAEAPMFRLRDLPYTYFFCNEEIKAIMEGIGAAGACFSSELFERK